MQNVAITAQPEFLGFELATAARKLLAEVMLTTKGEAVVITADTRTDMRVVYATAQAAHGLGAHPVVIWCESRDNTELEALAPVAAAVERADVWMDYAMDSYTYTDSCAAACEAGVRYGDFMGITVDGLMRMVGGVRYGPVLELGERLVELTSDVARFEVTTEAGTNVAFSNTGCVAEQNGGIADRPGVMIAPTGQATWSPVETSMGGTIVVDGMIWPPDEVGPVSELTTLTIDGGSVTGVAGGAEAGLLDEWLGQFSTPDVRRIAHVSYGFNPGVSRFVGNPGEDERLFGCLDFGFGSWIDRPAPGHFDVVIRSPTLVADGNVFQEGGRYVDPKLVECCRQLEMPGY